MKPYFIIIAAFFIFISCEKEKKTIDIPQEYTLHSINDITELSDSTFFSEIRYMSYENNKLYFTDIRVGQLVVLDNQMKVQFKLENKGIGPEEFIAPSYFGIKKDSIFVMDEMNQKLLIFVNNKFLKSFSPECFANSSKSFELSDGKIYFSGNTLEHSITCYDIRRNETECFGKLFDFDSPKQKYIRNGRYLAGNTEYLFSVSDNQPIIEVYAKSDKKLINKYDYSFIPFVSNTLRYTKGIPFPESSYFSLVNAVCSTEDKLYVLFNNKTNEDDFSSNRIVEFSFNNKSGNLETKSIYILPHVVCLAFCVDDNHTIYAYDYSKGAISIFPTNQK